MLHAIERMKVATRLRAGRQEEKWICVPTPKFPAFQFVFIVSFASPNTFCVPIRGKTLLSRTCMSSLPFGNPVLLHNCAVHLLHFLVYLCTPMYDLQYN